MSLRRRVIIGFVAIAAVLVMTNVALASTFHSFLLHRVDNQLTTAGVPLGNRQVFPSPRSGSDETTNEALTEYFVATGDLGSGTLTAVTGLLDPENRPPPKLTTAAVEAHLTQPGQAAKPFTAPAQSGSGEWRVVAVSNPFDGRVTVLGLSLEGLQTTLWHAREIQIAATLAVLAALGLVSFWTIRLGVHPIAAMAETAEKISGGDDLSTRVAHPDERTEAGRLGASFNAMLDRIQDAFRAREASEEKVRRFAADASHELRTPLTSIRGYAELWRAGALNDDAALADALSRVEAEAERMGVLVEDLLHLARLDRQQPGEERDVDLAEIAADAVADARAVEPDRPILLEVVPAAIRGSEPALRQVVANLLANVRAHTPASTPASVIVTLDGDHAELAVADEGPGMPDEVTMHVFERFYRADDARTRAAGGTGLGLAIVDSIVTSLGGTVSVTSAQGDGTRFAIRLPLVAGPATPNAPSVPAPAATP